MLFQLLARRKAAFEQARSEAVVLIFEHGDLAYSVARQRAREERHGRLQDPKNPPWHWERVRQAVRQMVGRDDPDAR